MKPIRPLLVPLLALLLAASMTWSASAVIPIPEYALLWGSNGVADGQFGTPWGVATDSAGNVYVTEISNHRVQVFQPDGTFLRTWGWGVDDGSDAFQVCTSSCQAGLMETADGAFWSPFGIATDSADHIYVVDSGNSRVQVFDSSGTFITKWGTSGMAAGQFSGPRGIAVDDAGHVFVTESGNNRVQEFDSSGGFIRMWGWGVDDGSNAFQICTTTCEAGSAGDGNGQFDYPSPIGIGPNGKIYVGSGNSHIVSKFDATGSFVSDFGGLGGGDGQFNLPEGIAVDGSGNVFISDYNNNRIQKFNASGTFLATWGSPGSNPGQFQLPQGLAFGPDGNLFIAEGNNHRIQVFARPSANVTIRAPGSVERGSIAKIRGTVASENAGCSAGRKVVLSTPTKTVLARGKTAASGAYAFHIRVSKRTKVLALVAADDECGGDLSVTKTIHVT